MKSKKGDISLKSLDGSCDLIAEKGHINLFINKLSANFVSVVKSLEGKIDSIFDPNIECIINANIDSNINKSLISVHSHNCEVISDSNKSSQIHLKGKCIENENSLSSGNSTLLIYVVN